MAIFLFHTLRDLFPGSLFNISESWEGRDVSIDSRTLEPGNVFIALKGEQFDGHNFLEQAFAQGASAAVISQDIPSDLSKYPFIKVKDTMEALNALGQWSRSQTTAKIIGITGSVGKTTCKEMLGHILASYGETISSPASYNNHYGVPFSLTKLNPSTEFGIFEIGMNHPGEISPLSKMVKPDIAIITRIAQAHIGQMGSLNAIAQEKASIFHGLSGLNKAILNHDDPFYEIIRDAAQLNNSQTEFISFGEHLESTVRLINFEQNFENNLSAVEFTVNGKSYHFHLNTTGKHLALNALGLIGIVYALGLDITTALKHIESFEFPLGRGRFTKMPLQNGSVTIIDDAYNANPCSMEASLNILANLPKVNHGRRIAVLGEMRELGNLSVSLHKALAHTIQELPIDLVLTCGTEMQTCYDALPVHLQGGHYQSAADIINIIREILKPDDIALFKGSNGIGIHKIIKFLVGTSSTAQHKVA